LTESLPMGALRAIGGHEQSHTLYYLAREAIDPPENLKKMVFPFLEESYKQIEEFKEKNSCAEYAGLGFLDLMRWLRLVFLQDCALLINMV